MSNRFKKSGPRPNSKPRRAEVDAAFQHLRGEIESAKIAFAWTIDLLIAKGVITEQELKDFFDQKKAETEALMHAEAQRQQLVPEAPCEPETSTPSSSILITI
jgi:uncharacterized protein YcaQ